MSNLWEDIKKANEENQKRIATLLAARTPEQVKQDEEERQMRIETDRLRRSTPTPPPAKQKCVFVTDSKLQVGETITDMHGRIYRVTKESYWLSQRDVNDLDDLDVFGVQAGWQTEARLV